MLINKLKKELKKLKIDSRKRINKEQDYVVSSLVKEPYFLKKEKSPNIEHKLKISNFLNEEEKTVPLVSLLPKIISKPGEFEINSKTPFSELDEWKKNKKFYGSIKKSIKKLEWLKYKLKIMIKRLKNKNLVVLSQSLINAVDLIEEAIIQINIGLSKTKHLPIQKNLKTYDKRESEFRPKDVFETKIYLIRMNIKTESIINLLRMVFLRRKIVFMLEDNLNYLKETVNTFFNSIFRNSFDNEILILTKEEYNRFKELHEDFIVLFGKKILGNDGKEIILKNNKFESKLVEIFFKTPDPMTGLKILRKELQDIYELSKEMRDFSDNNNNSLSRKKMIKHLEQVFFLKIKKNYFNILLGIVNDYFSKKIKFSEDYLEEKIEKMWR